MFTIPVAVKLQKHLGNIWPLIFLKVTPAGTETVPQINQEAVRLMKQLYNIDMEKTQYSKLLSALPPVDIVVTMGCNVNCPYLPCKYREDWGLEDPTGKDEGEYRETISAIEQKITALKKFIQTNFK